MSFGSWDPWRRMRRLQDGMNRLFANYERPRATVFPPVNIWSGEDGLVVTTELPGVDPEKLEITAVRDGLTIRGERETAGTEENRTWHRRERRSGEFSRRIELPYTVNAESVDASCRNGILRIALRRPEVDKPKRIEVKSS